MPSMVRKRKPERETERADAAREEYEAKVAEREREMWEQLRPPGICLFIVAFQEIVEQVRDTEIPNALDAISDVASRTADRTDTVAPDPRYWQQ